MDSTARLHDLLFKPTRVQTKGWGFSTSKLATGYTQSKLHTWTKEQGNKQTDATVQVRLE